MCGQAQPWISRWWKQKGSFSSLSPLLTLHGHYGLFAVLWVQWANSCFEPLFWQIFSVWDALPPEGCVAGASFIHSFAWGHPPRGLPANTFQKSIPYSLISFFGFIYLHSTFHSVPQFLYKILVDYGLPSPGRMKTRLSVLSLFLSLSPPSTHLSSS